MWFGAILHAFIVAHCNVLFAAQNVRFSACLVPATSNIWTNQPGAAIMRAEITIE
jgi:hypothetical protein